MHVFSSSMKICSASHNHHLIISILLRLMLISNKPVTGNSRCSSFKIHYLKESSARNSLGHVSQLF
jgi:hypothetical protein